MAVPRCRTMYCPEPSIQSMEAPSWFKAPGKVLTAVLLPLLTLYLLRAVEPKVNQYQVSGLSGARELSKLPGTLARPICPVVVLTKLRPLGERWCMRVASALMKPFLA